MKLSPKGAKFVTHHEGFVPRYYLDPVNIGTIGIGFTWRSSAFRAWWTKNRPGQKFGPGASMTRAEAEDALVYLMEEEYGAAVNRFLQGKNVPAHVFDGASSVVFNAGAATLTDRWAAALHRGDLVGAGDLLKTTRITAKGKRLQGLVNRRLDEAELITVGDYTIGRPRAEEVDAMADGVLRRRERGPAVEKLQLDLQAVGLYRDQKTDDIFGPGTEAAVMEFQRSVGLKDDGVAGPKTLAALKAAVEGRAPPAEPPAEVPVESAFPRPEAGGHQPPPIAMPSNPPSGGSSGSKPAVMTRAEMYRAAQALLAALEAGEN